MIQPHPFSPLLATSQNSQTYQNSTMTAAKKPTHTRHPTPVRSAMRSILFIVPRNRTRVLSNESFIFSASEVESRISSPIATVIYGGGLEKGRRRWREPERGRAVRLSASSRAHSCLLPARRSGIRALRGRRRCIGPWRKCKLALQFHSQPICLLTRTCRPIILLIRRSRPVLSYPISISSSTACAGIAITASAARTSPSTDSEASGRLAACSTRSIASIIVE